jgi:phosphoribosylanthranilate isomerase
VAAARAAVAAGADAVGFVFWPKSPRCVTPEAAAGIAAELPPFVVRVGVFVDAPRTEIELAAGAAGLDLLQLHGDEDAAGFAALPRRVLKAVRVGASFDAAAAAAAARNAAGLLVDAAGGAAPGGTGRTFDWDLVRGLRERVPFLVLAGGLHAGNVAEAVAAVDPHGVDVSSGVESAPGRKDEEKMRAFVRAARGGFARRAAS